MSGSIYKPPEEGLKSNILCKLCYKCSSNNDHWKVDVFLIGFFRTFVFYLKLGWHQVLNCDSLYGCFGRAGGGACQRLLWPTFKTLGLKQLRLSSKAFITSSCNSIVIVFTLQNCSHDYCGGSKHIIVLSYRVTLPERITLIISWGTCKWNYAVHTHFDIRNKKHLVSELRQICEREILCNISTFTYMLIWIDLEYQYKKINNSIL